MARLEDKLIAALYRTTCPESTELGEYYLGVITRERTEFIKQHLVKCPHCTREMNQLEAYLADLTPELEHSMADRIKILIARLVPDNFAGGPTLEPAFALRGEADGPRIYEAGDAQLTIEAQDDPGKAGSKSLLGLILGINPTGLLAHLWQEEQPVTTTNVDDLGNFTFSNLTPGQYELILSGPALEIHVQDMEV